ncbi:hypothetical protein Micbo1qcDRAFT_161235 [Microdochium bolleyi]|uniref:Ras-associating domain-containing protein n=1 Tax=Microdochium bolleyi TaxID=196109 RepID=A0A136J7X6_9PEZI|nr:hypothetical protein Micbo1qcDRAFT_161235 [Microdochium bolleyi]
MPPIQEQAPQPPKSQRSPVMEKFASLTKVRKPKAATTHAPKLGREAQGHPNDQAVGIVSGGMGIVPQTDAPASAINTADQIVAVRCRGNRFLLDVDADTTIVEIISKCARLVNDREINESSCVVLESYETLGLERRVRSFEAIRDIVNSWDLDSENCLVVRLREAGDSCNEPDSTTTSKSADPPKGCQVYMYHSNRPGKWNKRHITLLDNGQIISSKKQDAHAGDKDSINLCRLSDYDIYQPMESEKRRHLKPPKRHCFAIRSQQKTTVFLNTDNYVQYFSVEDPELASLFQRKVDAWRSWCLLDRRPEPRKQSVASPPRTFNAKDETKSSPGVVGRHTSRRSVNLSDHRPRRSVDESPHATGDFKPLLDLSFSDKRLSLFGANQGGSPRNSKELARPNRDSLIGRGLVDTIKVEDGFTGNGLLGNSYEERREAANQEGTEQVTRQGSQSDSNAFAEGPTLLNKQALADLTSPASNQPNSSTWFPSALEHTAKQSAIRPVTSATPANARQQPPSNEDSRYHKAGRVPGHQAGQYRPRDGYPSAGMGQPQMQRSHESRSVPPQSSRREQPKPLLDLNTPTINEPPQWQRKGHGVKAPSGLEHLVDFITTTDPNHPDARRGLGMLDVPPRNSRRPSPSGAGVSTPPTSGRARSHSLSNTSGNGRAMMAMAGSRAGGAAAPPMPSLPGRSRAAVDDYQRSRSDPMREREQRERERQRRKEQERAYREKEAAFNSVPGRNGTLKVV